MSYKLIVVESPEKAKVISTFLDKGWRVAASKGHILDLPEKEYGVKRENNSFSGEYVPSQDSKKIITEIASLVSGAEEVFLATDDDREGEKIASDLVEQCKMKKYHRVTFSEISKKEVITSLENPRKIDAVRLASQKARRLIDRIVGYPGSAAIVQDFKNLGIPYEPSSIGRSIAPALRLLCQVEEAIQDFEDNPPEKKQLIRVKLEKEKVYACDNFRMNCKFMIFKEQSIKFFESFGKRVDESFLKDIIKGALNSSPIMVELVSPKKGTTFSAFIIIESQKTSLLEFKHCIQK